MGASGWAYYVPYQADLNAALQQLRAQVFADGDYYWIHGSDFLAEEKRQPRPATMAELFNDGDVQETGTHSIIDMWRMVREGEEPGGGLVQPLTSAEMLQYAGTERLTRDHVDAIQPAAGERWFGRAAVLHDAQGEPSEIYFWGASGD